MLSGPRPQAGFSTTSPATTPITRPCSAILQRLYDEQLRVFNDAPDAAAKLIAAGEARRRDAALPVAEVAATTVLASAVMNFDEFVMKR